MPAMVEKNKAIQASVDEKTELAIKLLSLTDQSIVHTIKLIFDDITAAATKKTTTVRYNKEIDAAVKKVRHGTSVSNDDVMDEMDKW